MDDYDEEYFEAELEKDRALRSKRRRATAMKKRQEREIAEIGHYPGPYYDEKKERVINPGRGKRSKELKKASNRKVRHADLGSAPGEYRKAYDYWWEH